MSRFLILLFLFSCAGYKYRSKQNPFAQFGINSLSVPMFYNHSNYADIESVFTQEIFNTMLEYNGLELKSGNKPSDAVLIGIIESRDKLSESMETVITKSADNTFGEDVLGTDRDDLLLPRQRSVGLKLRLIVIKHPTREEIKFLTSKMGENAVGSKVIFNEVIGLNSTQTLKSLRGEGIKVLGSQNRGLNRQTMQNMAKSAANNFKDMILYAF
ncbi:MAG: hypothetical protein CME62_11125 [Halobacteriovoraceae bacterium]|nr:hypothetical protein [Halobacteriovoraceae bacterium]|tara:strand:- start:10934 stop:11575 length:642 start_codon:yes stop_codon:yes gene_type:complete